MKTTLLAMWAAFVIGVLVALFAIQNETDRLREQQTHDRPLAPRSPGGKPALPGRRIEVQVPIAHPPARPAGREQRPGGKEATPTPRGKPETVAHRGGQ